MSFLAIEFAIRRATLARLLDRPHVTTGQREVILSIHAAVYHRCHYAVVGPVATPHPMLAPVRRSALARGRGGPSGPARNARWPRRCWPRPARHRRDSDTGRGCAASSAGLHAADTDPGRTTSGLRPVSPRDRRAHPEPYGSPVARNDISCFNELLSTSLARAESNSRGIVSSHCVHCNAYMIHLTA